MPKFIIEYEVPLDDHFTFNDEVIATDLNDAIKTAIKKHEDTSITITFNDQTTLMPAKVKARKISLLK